jgi:hypothetical protein
MKAYFSKRSIAVLLAAIVLVAGQSQVQAVTDEQQAKLKQIDKYIESCKKDINFRYSTWIAELQAKEDDQQRLNSIGNPEMFIPENFVAWTEYIKDVLDLRGVDLRNDPQFTHTFDKFRGSGLSIIERFDLAPKLMAIAEKRLVKDENRALRGYTAAQVQLEQEREYALNVQLPAFQEQLRNNVLNPPQPPAEGTVSGVVYSDDMATAVIGTKIVHQGEKTGDIKVVKISSEGVEFEKNGHKWTQKIGEAASSQWQ